MSETNSLLLVSRRFGVNPDNVATPVAAALGDLVTLALLSLVSSLLRSAGYTPQLIILVLYIVIAVYCYRSLFDFKPMTNKSEIFVIFTLFRNTANGFLLSFIYHILGKMSQDI